MSIIVEWDDAARTVIRLTYTGKWDWEDHHEAWHKIVQMTDFITDQRIDVIGDHRASIELPPGVLQASRQTRAMIPPTTGLMITVSDSPLFKSMYSMYLRVYPHEAERIRIVKSLDEARKLINESRNL